MQGDRCLWFEVAGEEILEAKGPETLASPEHVEQIGVESGVACDEIESSDARMVNSEPTVCTASAIWRPVPVVEFASRDV